MSRRRRRVFLSGHNWSLQFYETSSNHSNATVSSSLVQSCLLCGCNSGVGEGNGNPPQYPGLENPHGQRSLVGCSPWGRWVSDTTERLHFHFSLLCIGEGKGSPLQCSCLENPRTGEPGGLQSMGSHKNWTRLSSNSSSSSGVLSCLSRVPSLVLWARWQQLMLLCIYHLPDTVIMIHTLHILSLASSQ